MKNALFYSLFVSIICVSFQVSAQCDLPVAFEGNTGSNMTVMLTSTSHYFIRGYRRKRLLSCLKPRWFSGGV